MSSTDSTKGYDPRAVANLLLDDADRKGLSVSHLPLQKFLYFAHGYSLVQYRRPLVFGFFEAWQYGPVHPLVYDAFQTAGDRAITFRATAVDPLTGGPASLQEVSDPLVHRAVSRVLDAYGETSVGVLLDVAHAKGGAWDVVVQRSKTRVVLGMRISNELIVERFGRHLVGVNADARRYCDARLEPYGDSAVRHPQPRQT